MVIWLFGLLVKTSGQSRRTLRPLSTCLTCTGALHSQLSGISSKDCLKDNNDGDEPGKTTNTFYARDCQDVGLRPDRPPSHLASPNSERILDLDKLPLDEEDIPDIEREMTKSTLQDTMVRHPSLCNMTFKVVNVAYYHGHKAKVEQVRRRWREFYRELHRADLLLLRAAGVQAFPTRNLFTVTSDRKTAPLVNKH